MQMSVLYPWWLQDHTVENNEVLFTNGSTQKTLIPEKVALSDFPAAAKGEIL